MTRSKPPDTTNVVDIREKLLDKATDQVRALMQTSADLEKEGVDLIVAMYREWERTNPELALRPRNKTAMVRLGFVGPGGFDRCREPHRLPESAFRGEDGEPAEEIQSDRDGSEVLMCPAMESRACQGAWRGMGMPPCYLLLLEVDHGLGGGCQDDRVPEVLDDFGKWPGPEEYAESFARAEELLRRHK